MTEPEGGPDEAGLADLVARAQAADAEALAALLDTVTDRVYRLALRMVTRPADAEDATQEILIRVMTRLSTFRGESAFTTWVHRVAVNHLLDRRRSCTEQMELTFEDFADDLLAGLSAGTDAPDAELLAEEVRLACTQAMLACLDRDHRVAYVLGEVFELPSDEAAEICDVPPATYRKRLSRARARVRSFVGSSCGLVNPEAPCRCRGRVDVAIRTGRIDRDNLQFVDPRLATARREMGRLFDAADLFRSHPEYAAPDRVRTVVRQLVRSGGYQVLG